MHSARFGVATLAVRLPRVSPRRAVPPAVCVLRTVDIRREQRAFAWTPTHSGAQPLPGLFVFGTARLSFYSSGCGREAFPRRTASELYAEIRELTKPGGDYTVHNYVAVIEDMRPEAVCDLRNCSLATVR